MKPDKTTTVVATLCILAITGIQCARTLKKPYMIEKLGKAVKSALTGAVVMAGSSTTVVG
jgi:hypothetical protein